MLEQCDGYKRLLAAVKRDHKPQKERQDHDYLGKLQWVVDRATHYAEKTGLAATEILDAWEANRNYWYMNYYQDANQPLITGDTVRVFETLEDLQQSVGKEGFRCPKCDGVSSSPYACNSGKQTRLMQADLPTGTCNWKVYGLFGHMGSGVAVFVKSELKVENIFMPIAWETADE